MEVVASIVSSVLVESGRHLCGSVCSYLKTSCQLKSNLIALEEKMQRLEDIRDKVSQELKSCEEDGTEKGQWLVQAENILSEKSSVQLDYTVSNKSNLCWCFLNCNSRYKLSGQVEKLLKQVNQLVEAAGNFPSGSVVVADKAVPRVEHLPEYSYENQSVASRTLAKIMQLLNDDGVRRIGIWGMGGVGKTTLVKNLNNKLKTSSATQPFSIVIWVTVSKQLNLKKVQTEIAGRLNLEVKAEGSLGSVATRLYQRLEREKKFLLILDDVWEKVDLHSLGVPLPEVHSGSKIIMTSRFLEVCRTMKTDADVKLDVLDNGEAWQLFLQNAGEVANSDAIRPYAEAVAKECCGLPLAIITMALTMRGKTITKLWKHALSELQRSVPSVKGVVEESVFKSLKLSYDSLEGYNIKACFLYCSLFPEDFSIEVKELVRYWLAEGLIGEQQNYENSINSGIALIENLKDSCLLEIGNIEGTVKMHDVVRDVAIWITSSLENGCKSLVQSGIGLSQVSKAMLSHECFKRVSFMNNSISALPDCEIQCSQTSTLLLQGNLPLKEVPERFLLGFQALKVLNLSGTRIQSLPVSLLQLADLCALLLGDCFYLEELPPLGGLQKLQMLDLCATRIKALPTGIESVSSLRQLNLSRTHYLESIPTGTVSKLSSLEVLDMTLSAYHWGVKGQSEEGEATFEDLGCLKHFVVLSIRLERVPSISSEDLAWINRLRKFQFYIGPKSNYLPTKHDKRRVTISGLDLSEEWIGSLLTNASCLVLKGCLGLNEMLEDLVINNVGCFAGLKSLTITNSNSTLRPGGGCAAHLDLLPNLEQLHLHGLTYLKSISELVGQLGLWLSRLKVIEVSYCKRLKHLLSVGTFIETLGTLEVIKVSFCEELDELFSYCSEQGSGLAPPVMPNLRRMELRSLPKLRTVCREREPWQCVEQLQVVKCSRLRKLPLTVQNADTLKEIRGEVQWWRQLEWDKEVTKLSMESRFIQEGSTAAASHDLIR